MVSKKKILFIIYSLAGGGAEKALITLLHKFDYNRFDVDLLLFVKEGVYLNDIPKKVNLRYAYNSVESFRIKIDFIMVNSLGLSCRYKQRIKSKVQYYDTIVSFTEQALKYHSWIFDRARKNISWIHTDLLHFHYTVVKDDISSLEQERSNFSKLDDIVFVSNDAKKQFEKLYPDNEIKKIVIYNLIDSKSISRYRKNRNFGLKDKIFTIVSVGRLHSIKGFDRLLRIAKKLKDDNYNFHIKIIGEGAERNNLENFISEYHLEEYVSLLGFVNPPYNLMADADLFISTSIAEGFSLVVCEAFCLGLPVVCTKTTGPIELLDNDKYGLLTEHDDESIYQAVKKMINDDFLREHYHKKSLERAEIFDMDSVMSKIYTVLD